MCSSTQDEHANRDSTVPGLGDILPAPKNLVTDVSIPIVPNRKFLLGHLLDFRVDNLEWMRAVASHGDIVKWYFGPFAVVHVNHPDLIREVLVRKASSFYKTRQAKRNLSEVTGNGILISDGDFWLQQHKLVQPALDATRIQSYADIMVDHTLRRLEQWEPEQELNIWEQMSSLSLGIVAKSLFDADVSDVAYRVAEIAAEGQASINRRFNRFFDPPRWLPIEENRRRKERKEGLDAIIMPIIEQRRESGEQHGDLLDMLLSAQGEESGIGMSDRQVRDEAVTLFLAGHETTALALTWTWYLLAQHPEVEARLYNELERELRGRPPSFEDLKLLPYLRAVLDESMRLYPPAWVISREVVEPVEIGGYPLKKGQVVFISPYGLHRDPTWFDDPDRFDPDRFLGQRREALPKYAYIPFGAGPRVCVGNNFALMEVKLVLATTAQRFALRLLPGQAIEKEALVTLRPRHGIRMRLEMRVPEPFAEESGRLL